MPVQNAHRRLCYAPIEINMRLTFTPHEPIRISAMRSGESSVILNEPDASLTLSMTVELIILSKAKNLKTYAG